MIFTLNFDPLNPQNHCFSLGKTMFFKKSFFEVGIDVCSILVPTSLRFSSKNQPQSFQKSIPRCITFSIDLCIDFSSILIRFWKPTWSHVGYFLPQNTAPHPAPAPLFVGSIFFLVFFWVGLHFASF